MDTMRHTLIVALLLAATLIAARWLIIRFPWVACSRCGGNSQKNAPVGRRFRFCGKCGGSGKQVSRLAVWLGVNRETGKRAGR